MVGPRFEQTAEQFQPRPLAAIELIAQEPVRKVNARVVACDGGKQLQSDGSGAGGRWSSEAWTSWTG